LYAQVFLNIGLSPCLQSHHHRHHRTDRRLQQPQWKWQHDPPPDIDADIYCRRRVCDGCGKKAAGEIMDLDDYKVIIWCKVKV